MDGRRDQVRIQLQKWREDLIDLTKRNRLLYFRHLRSGSLGFEQDPMALLDGFSRRGAQAGWGFYLPADQHGEPSRLVEENVKPPRPDELVVIAPQGKDARQIERSLRTLGRKSQAELLDTGLWVLYLGLGTLRWQDGDDEVSSPLYLHPVRLERQRGSDAWRLRAHDDAEPALNPSLAVKLDRDFDITLPPLDELDNDSYSAAIKAVRHAVRQNKTWRVEETAILSTFTFQKEVIYRDLQTNEDALAGHPLVRLLAEGPTGAESDAMHFTPEPEDHLDQRHPPEDLMCIMDADASQRQCLVAARQGKSFVMDGPPGTGKSQTIANMIAQLLHDHKTVLFVSEKAAALEVVRDRLRNAGLDPFILELHSLKATRKAVAQALGEALAREPRAKSGFTESDRARLRRERERLTSYALAVNEVRKPSHMSFHDVVGEISGLGAHPVIPVPGLKATSLDPVSLGHINDLADRLSRAWAPVEQGEQFLWRNLATTPTSSATETACIDRVRRLRSAMQNLKNACESVQEDLWVPGVPTPKTAEWQQELLELVERRPQIAEEWLTTPDPAKARDLVAGLADEAERLSTKENELAEMEPTWSGLDASAAARLKKLRNDLAKIDLLPGATNRSSVGLRSIRDAMLEAIKTVRAAEQVAAPLGQAFHVGAEMTPVVLDRLIRLARLAESETPPEPNWFCDGQLRAASAACRELAEIVPSFIARRDDLMHVFKPSALELDLATLHERFIYVHRGLRKLRSSYRADKRRLAASSVAGKITHKTLSRLDELVELQANDRHLCEIEAGHDGILGAYYPDRDRANLEVCRAALDLAEHALAIAGDTVSAPALAAALGRTQEPDRTVADAAEQAADRLVDLRGGELAAWMDTAMLRIESMSLRSIAEWCGGLASVVEAMAEEVGAVESVLGRPVELAEAGDLLDRRVEQARLAASVEDLARRARGLIGDLADAPNAEELRTASDWIDSIRGHLGGEIEQRTANSILTSDLRSGHISEARLETNRRIEVLLEAFESPYRDALREDLRGSYDAAFELLDALEDTAPDMHIWSDHVEARDELSDSGLEPAVLECQQRRSQAEDVPRVLRLALLRRWADQISDSDRRLRPRRRRDRDAILRDFQRLDRQLVQNTAATVITRCAQQRPRSKAGGAGLIGQQAELRRRHIPVRTLLSKAGEASQRLKPCFMMSPLSVSQFLPSDLRFDVVIFDEASQVKEADAVGCIYRGNQLIVAGDQKQLPPTSFFDRMADTDEEDLDETLLDFESVLDRCKANGLVGLPLNWHYRSRHESLITFSNRSFYGGRLHTFPSAVFESKHLGVEFRSVEGVYRRGTTRDNLEEAVEVVDRVLFHRRYHPELTLGVVTLSTAQQAAVETEIERRARTEPELLELVTDDRLSGFFVKNLETVQGDERDIVILTIGYGPDEHGKVYKNFGPMNKQGGERRLNVAVTRARQRVEVVTSISGGDIRSDGVAASLAHLARYLEYAEHGPAALAIDLKDSQGEPESPFEEEVIESVRSMGYEAVPQVGVAGYRIDIGIRHPDKPGRYLLGIECDGASYHSSKVARDRDRLRQQILEGLGWTIHRIWSTAWFASRRDEEQRIRKAISEALTGSAALRPEQTLAEPEVEFVDSDLDARPHWANAYVEPLAAEGPSKRHEFHEPESQDLIRGQIHGVVSNSGPIHKDAVLRAVRKEWLLNRSGQRMRSAFDRALGGLAHNGEVQQSGDWLEVPGQHARVRAPTDAEGPRRPVHEVPPNERKLAVLLLLRDAGPSRSEDLRQAWARLYGWARVGPDIAHAFNEAVKALTTDGRVDVDGQGRLTAPSDTA